MELVTSFLESPIAAGALRHATPRLCLAALWAMSWSCRLRPTLRRRLLRPTPYDATLQFTTRDRRGQVWATFAAGALRAGLGRAARADVTVVFRDERYMRRFFSPSGTDVFGMLLDNHMAFEGNLNVLARFGELAAAVAQGGQPRERDPELRWPTDSAAPWQALTARRPGEPYAAPADGSGAPLLRDPSFAHLTLDDFPRLKQLLHQHLHTRPRICTERARLYTEAALRERRRAEDPVVLRQARIFAHVLDHKRAIVRDDDLLLGTTTSQRVGVQIFPELGGTAIWPELLTVEARPLNPYEISPDDVRVLNEEVFPHWVNDNIREWTRARFGNPACLRLDERWVLYFLWKNHAISHTIADMPAVLQRGLRAMASEARDRERDAVDGAHRDFARAAALCLEAVGGYAARLAQAAEDRAHATVDPARRAELEQMAAVCRRVPAEPARTLHEALNAVWICFLALHQENMNAGLSIGRLDSWLQPYLERDLATLTDPEDRERAVHRALELVGAFLLKATDHLPLVADIGNRLFGGSSSDQVITLGGVKPDGSSAVGDMTYLLLKATEMLALRDPNMNARYCPGTNPEPYLRRLCEVNLITSATPSLHNDRAVITALERQGFPVEDARDWGATGCVEPTVCGRHFGHTNCMMFSMVAPLEMTLHDGVHPLLEEQVGPRTGDPLRFAGYDELLTAYKRQVAGLLDQAVQANNLLGEAHRALHPTPFLSALIQGPLESGRDVTDGGARYNSSGVAMVGLADVVDSLAAIKTLVYERRRVTMPQLLTALAADFVGHETLRAEILQRVPKFGSADPLPTAITADLVDFVFDDLQAKRNVRGGRYLPGYWSMSNHVAFGLLSGALPSGRQRGKPFTPGITPSPLSQTVLLDNIRQVAALPAEKLPNNIAFNIKIAPGGADDHHQVVERMTAYAKTYFDLGGMQLQFNVVSSDTLRSAMANPEAYRGLLVRISGYNAYFVELNRDMQLELIERVEHR